VDVAARSDFLHLVYDWGEVAEVTRTLRDLLKFKYGSSAPGEIFIGYCPHESKVEAYQPPLTFSAEPNPLFWPIQRQQRPMSCDRRN
jgi:hypothetical protein